MAVLLVELRDLMDNWLNSRKHANLSVLARVSGVSYATLRRIAQGEITPVLSTTLQLAPVLLETNEAQKFVAKHFPEVAKVYGFDQDLGYQLVPAQDPLRSMTADELIVFSMAAQKDGISRVRLEKRLGEAADAAVTRLLGLGLLIESSPGRIQTPLDQTFIPGLDSTLHRIKLALECFDRQRENEAGSFHALYTHALNQEGIDAAHDVLCEAERKLMNIFKDHKLRGKKVLYHALVSSFIDAKGEDLSDV